MNYLVDTSYYLGYHWLQLKSEDLLQCTMNSLAYTNYYHWQLSCHCTKSYQIRQYLQHLDLQEKHPWPYTSYCLGDTSYYPVGQKRLSWGQLQYTSCFQACTS